MILAEEMQASPLLLFVPSLPRGKKPSTAHTLFRLCRNRRSLVLCVHSLALAKERTKKAELSRAEFK
jgi:hypothetical protein